MSAGRWHDFLLHQAETRAQSPAFSDSLGHRWTWAETAAAARAAEGRLRAAGVGPGDRVVLVTENCCAAVAFLFGASMLGAPVVPFNARQTEHELARVMAHAEPACTVFLTEVSSNAGDHAQRHKV